MAENPKSPAYKYQLAHLDDDQGPATIAGAGIMMFLCIMVTIGRFMAQSLLKRGFAIDDYMILAALVINLGLCVTLILCVKYGLGRHVVRLERDDPNLLQDITNVFKCGYTMSLGAIPSLFLIKMSLVLYYRRIFTIRNSKVKYALWTVGVYITATFIASFVIFVYQCDPIPYFWYRAYALVGEEPPIRGTCLPSEAHQVAPGAFNSFADLLILILPGFALWPLQMRRAKKIGLFFVFSLGAFVVATSVVKIVFAVQVSNTSDSTYVNTGILLWTVVESCIGQVCACIPTLMPLAAIFRHGPRRAFRYARYGPDSDSGWTVQEPTTQGDRKRHKTGLISDILRSVDETPTETDLRDEMELGNLSVTNASTTTTVASLSLQK